MSQLQGDKHEGKHEVRTNYGYGKILGSNYIDVVGVGLFDYSH